MFLSKKKRKQQRTQETLIPVEEINLHFLYTFISMPLTQSDVSYFMDFWGK